MVLCFLGLRLARRTGAFWLIVGSLSLALAPASGQALTSLQLMMLDVDINQRQMPQIIDVYLDAHEQLWLSKTDLSAMGLKLPVAPEKILAGQAYLPLIALPGVRYTLDPDHLRLSLKAVPQAFNEQVINNTQDQTVNNQQSIRPEIPGGFLNYDISAEHTPGEDTSANTAALAEFGFFNHYGTGSTHYLFQSDATDSNHVTRLDTTWTQDQPEHLASWRLGDSITSSVPWSGAVRFGGVQYARNFNTQPNLVTFPLPNIQGEAVLPSTVSLFVNNTLNQQNQVNSGPFTINNVPVINGAGTMSVVTQDILGREQVVTLPYYAAPQLLAPGLTDFSYESGFTRENYGVDSNDYGRFVSSATYGKGLNNDLTVTSHGELLKDQQTVGAASSYLWHQLGVLSFSLAASRAAGQGGGGLIGAGFNRQATPLNYGIQTTLTSADFTQVGLLPGQLSPISTTQIFSGYDMGRPGSFAVTYTLTRARNDDSEENSFVAPSSELLTVSYSKTLVKSLSLTAGVIDSLKNHQDDQAFLMLTLALDTVHSASINTTHQNGEQQYSGDFTKALPVGNGYGYQVHSSQGVNDQSLGSATVKTDIGQYNAAISQLDGQNNYRMGAQGSIIHFGGVTELSRNFDSGGSFGLVQVPGFDKVRVYDQNQLIGTTDPHGNLFIPNLLPYQNNAIAIDPKDLPIDSQVDEVEKNITPYYKSGSLIQFPVKKTHAVVFHLKQLSGEYVPTGALLNFSGSDQEYLVGEQGEVYFENMTESTQAGTAHWHDQTCHFLVQDFMQQEIIPDLGESVCQ